jgi:hypothetical protein
VGRTRIAAPAYVTGIALLAAAAAACGGSEPAPSSPRTIIRRAPDPSLPPGYLAPPLETQPPLSDEAFFEAVEEIGRRAERARTTAASPEREDIALRTLELLDGTPNVADAGAAADFGSVWTRLVDGVPVVVLLDRDPPPPGAPNPLEMPWPMTPPAGPARAYGELDAGRLEFAWQPPAEGVMPAAARHAAPAGRIVRAALQFGPPQGPAAPPQLYAIPRSEKAWATHADNLSPNAAPAIQKMLDSRGYDVNSDNSTEAFRSSIRNVGVIWISTHGAPYPDASGRARFGIVTGEDVLRAGCTRQPAPPNCLRTLADVHARRAFPGVLRGRPFVMVNADWIKSYWRLAPNSLVFVDACLVFATGPEYAEFRDAFKDPAVAINATVLGWTGYVESGFAERAATWFFSRVLGSDAYLPPSPPQRPFSAPEVHQSMASSGKTVDTAYLGAALMLTQQGPEASILVPSIRNMTVVETNKALHLYGQFGGVPGEITIDGEPRGSQWGHAEVVVSIPDSGPGSKGPVVATLRRRHASNAAPLTDWIGKIRLRHTFLGIYGAPGPYYELECSRVHFRADVHPFRMVPEEPAVAGSTWFGATYDSVIPIENITADSKCTGRADAFGLKTSNNSTMKTGFVLPRRDLPWADQSNTPAAGPWFFGLGRLDPLKRELVLGTSSFAESPKGLTMQQVLPRPGPVFTQRHGFSSAVVNDVILRRQLRMDAQFHVAPYRTTFDAPFGPFKDKGEWEIEARSDPATLPDAKTPG